MTSPLGATLTVVGSGTLLPDGGRGSPAHHLATGQQSVLLDCGSGTMHGLARLGIAWQALTHLLITHFHVDHIGDVAPLVQALDKGVEPRRSEPLTVIGPPGIRRLLDRLRAAFGAFVTEPAFPLRVVELERDGRYEEDGLTVRACPAEHSENAIAIRVEGAWGAVGYTGDTGPSHEVAAHLAGVDVLITECTQPDPPDKDGHLSPAGVVALARTVEPRLLLVTHVSRPLSPETAVAEVASRWEGRVAEAADGLRVHFTEGTLTVDPP